MINKNKKTFNGENKFLVLCTLLLSISIVFKTNSFPSASFASANELNKKSGKNIDE